MQFKVLGAMKATGEDIEVSIEADDFMEVQRKANQMGIMVSKVLPVEQTAQVTKENAKSVQLIEQTEKKWKLQMIWGWMIRLASIPLLILAVVLFIYEYPIPGLCAIVLAGIVLFVGGFIQGAAEGNKFWYHE